MWSDLNIRNKLLIGIGLPVMLGIVIMYCIVYYQVSDYQTQFLQNLSSLKITPEMQKMMADIMGLEQNLISIKIRDMMISLSILIFFVLAALGSSWFFVVEKHIIKNLVYMSHGMLEMEKGNFDYAFDFMSRDEVGHIAFGLRHVCRAQKQKILLAEAIANGNLTVNPEIASQYDKFGMVFEKMVENLRTTITNIKNTAKELHQSAVVLDGSSGTLSTSAKTQVASLEEISSALTEMNSMLQLSAENTKEAKNLSLENQNSAKEGKTQVEKMFTSMQEINSNNTDIIQEVDASYGEISRIVLIIKEIENKTKVINDIVFQTKILSFNASVEAARAGEHGKGFSVVAEEIGSLARMSGNAAKDISNLLNSSIVQVEQTIAKSSENVKQKVSKTKEHVEQGIKIASDCVNMLDKIVASAVNLEKIIGSISTNVNEEAHGIQEITHAVVQLEQISQLISSTAHESTETSRALNTNFDVMNKLVASFKSSQT